MTNDRQLRLAIESSCFASDWWHKGVANYTRHILDRLSRQHELISIGFGKEFHPLAKSDLPAAHKLRAVEGRSGMWRNTALRQLVESDKINLAWFPFHIVPWLKSPVQFVTTVHDISFILKPMKSTALKAVPYFTIALVNALWRSRIILAVSNTTGEDLVDIFPWAKLKIRVARHGLPDDCRTLSDQLLDLGELNRKETAVAKVLFLDGANPRKRLDVALKACSILAEKRRLRLIVTGESSAIADICRKTLGAVPNFVVMAGLLSRADLLQEMATSNIVAYLSHYEGFGFPIIEGMSLGAQVVTFGGRAEKEVGETCAIYPISDSCVDVASAITLGIENSLDQVQTKRNVDHARSFSWDLSAKVHWEAFQESLHVRN